MYYELLYDMENIDKSIRKGTNAIYAEATNMDEIEYPGIRKGFFDRIILKALLVDIKWPEVIFYYSSKVSTRESDYLLNIKRWPIVHKRVADVLGENEISGIRFYPIKLIDVVSDKINNNYYLMYIENFIDAFDMQRSKFVHNEEYDFYTFVPKKTFMNTKECAGYDIFRCKRSLSNIFVSQKFKDIVEKNQWTGFHFEEWL